MVGTPLTSIELLSVVKAMLQAERRPVRPHPSPLSGVWAR
jgi:hypothetical protein